MTTGLRHFLTASLACACLIAPVAHASEASAVVTVFEKYRLPNGLEVILSRDDRLPIVSVNLWYHVGAVHERAGRTGFAHLFEHMMFQGSAHVASGQHLALLERAGATDLNASTDFDRTNYYQTLPSNYLETALWLESDRMGFLLDALTDEKFAIQRQVVQNERRQRVENAPYGVAEERAWQALFPAPHPYFGNVIGSMADLNRATLDDVREFFRTYYTPQNASLVIVGDFDPIWTRAAVAKYFGTLPASPKPTPAPIPRVAIASHAQLSAALRPETLAFAWLGWRSPPALTQADAAADVLAAILSQGKSSRLYTRLIQQLQLAQSVSASQQSLAAQSAFVIQAVARPGVAPERLSEEINAELQRIRDAGVKPEEIERARRVIETRLISSIQSYSGLAERLQYYNQYVGDPGYFARDLARYEAVTADAIRAFARDVLADAARVSMLARPEGG